MSTTTTTGWVGWIRFAGVIIILSGAFSLLQGLVAVIGPSSYYVVANGSLFLLDVTGWGWWNIIIGALLVITGVALLAGQLWARVVAVVLAGLSAIGQMFLIPAQPWWAIIVIGIDLLIIYAVMGHGHELEKAKA